VLVRFLLQAAYLCLIALFSFHIFLPGPTPADLEAFADVATPFSKGERLYSGLRQDVVVERTTR